MKQTKLHLILILSVVLILLLFVSCSEKEPTVTTDGTVATETVITTTAPVTTTDYYAQFAREDWCTVVNIPLPEVNDEEIREILKDNFESFDSECDYLIYQNESENFKPYNGDKRVEYVYLRNDGLYMESAYKFILHEGNIRLIYDYKHNRDFGYESAYDEFLVEYDYAEKTHGIFDRGLRESAKKKEIIIKAIDKLFDEHPSGYGFYGYAYLNGEGWYYVQQGIGRFYCIIYRYSPDPNETE